ncbi:MAG: hypothetical protein F6K18_22600 [Okeania sp. SIO2C2]|uniref:hypothetical protein n=1 Tax=Okeania sp. SIO2C2 TaxID=2607787 RepID=UPI0013BDF707|nr:hypothetical protein [Okeania sp. SIO2C2]NEP89398.1 hypothetical protein [Okeania sp. SIO2C2]
MKTFFDAKIEIIEINKYQERSGFSGKYHLVKFLLQSGGINSFEVNIWVHSNYPEAEIIKVARTFLNRRLQDFVELTTEEIYTSDEVDALWQSVKPENFCSRKESN